MSDVVCPFCHHAMADEMSVLVNLDGSLTLVCWSCYDRGTEAATYGDEPDEETADVE